MFLKCPKNLVRFKQVLIEKYGENVEITGKYEKIDIFVSKHLHFLQKWCTIRV